MKIKKSTFQCSVYMGEEGVNIYCESSRVFELLKGSFVPYIPEWRIEKQENKEGCSLECIFCDTHVIKMDGNNKFFISGAFEKFSLSFTIPYFIHYILEFKRSQKGKATIHAAAVSKDGKGILFLGKQGSGKTSITLELCRKHGYSLIGNDLVLAGSQDHVGYLYGGTKIFRIRAASIKDYNKDLRKFFPLRDKDEWTNVAIIKPYEIQVSTEKSIIPIQAIYYVHLYPKGHDFLAKQVEKLFSHIYLYQIFSEYIRGSAIIPLLGKNMQFSAYVSSLDTNNAFERRVKLINWIIEHKNFKYLSGPLPDICAFINKKVDHDFATN